MTAHRSGRPVQTDHHPLCESWGNPDPNGPGLLSGGECDCCPAPLERLTDEEHVDIYNALLVEHGERYACAVQARIMALEDRKPP